MGRRRSTVAQRLAHSKGKYGGITRTHWMAAVYRHGDKSVIRQKRTSGIPFMGQLCHREGKPHRPQQASDFENRTPFPTLGKPRILRMQTFFKDK